MQRLLIANRGEIACRIARTAHRLGISTVGVYSEPDRDALHVDAVDVAVALGGVTSAESYLRGDVILQAAIDAGADAVHPGYGFLAENAEFAQSVIDAGLTWVGPTPDHIRLLGDKIAAKRAAVAAGVPTTDITEIAPGDKMPRGLQLPVLVKAAAGGGGRGMRIVRDAAAFSDAVDGASREALSAFGDGTVFVEPYIERGRHVEVQIFGDSHGNVVHLGDRECSIQRRNQKVVEEAPSPGISEAVRTRLHEGALALARHVGYLGAGTVEFMVGDSTDGDPTIAFLEVNTRLQVEHPVTEAITGLDLVELQLLVAAGHRLPVTQDGITFNGHAIEVRIVAEDPVSGWMPSTGEIREFIVEGDVRIDAGFRAGDLVSSQYDSMLAKVIAHHEQRGVAARRIARALRQARIVGIRTNVNMLAATMGEPDFLDGRTFTSYLDEHPAVTADLGPTGDDRLALVIAATMFEAAAARSADRVTGFAPSGWRNVRTRGQRRSWIDETSHGSWQLHQIEYRVRSDVVDVLVGAWPEPAQDGSLPDDERRAIEVRVVQNGDRVVVEFGGRRHLVDVAAYPHDVVVAAGTEGSVVLVRPRLWIDHDETAIGAGPVSPLPGTVIAIHVEAGDTVADGQVLMVVEAMKMEHKIIAAAASIVAELRFKVGDRVDQGDLLVALDPLTLEQVES